MHRSQVHTTARHTVLHNSGVRTQYTDCGPVLGLILVGPGGYTSTSLVGGPHRADSQHARVHGPGLLTQGLVQVFFYTNVSNVPLLSFSIGGTSQDTAGFQDSDSF